MSRFGKKITADDAPALPMWIDGHAYLMMAKQFLDVQDDNGNVVRRVPLYGEEAVEVAAASAQKAFPLWHAQTIEARQACVHSLHELLARYRAHLAKLIETECGVAADLADSELEQALAAVAVPMRFAEWAGVAAVLGDARAPLAGPLALALEALAAGWAVVLKTSPKAPSALFAGAELFSRAGFPPGLVNCVHGDESAVRALCENAGTNAMAFVGDDRLGVQIGQMASAHGKPYVGGSVGEALRKQWRERLGGGN